MSFNPSYYTHMLHVGVNNFGNRSLGRKQVVPAQGKARFQLALFLLGYLEGTRAKRAPDFFTSGLVDDVKVFTSPRNPYVVGSNIGCLEFSRLDNVELNTPRTQPIQNGSMMLRTFFSGMNTASSMR
jgi:hypothetical protein